MKPEQLQDALNDVNEEYIADAHADNKQEKTTTHRKSFRIALATAASLVLLAGGGFLLTRHFGKQTPPSQYPAEGVYIPPAEIPKPSATADMIGLICHNGKVYISTGSYGYSGFNILNGADEARQNKDEIFRSVGTYLGEAVSNIDEWNWGGPEGVVDLASTSGGSVYTTAGYDEDFRICKAGSWSPEEGVVYYYLDYYECLTGITLIKGSDLLEDRLRLSQFLPADLDENTQTLLAAMNEAPFVYVESRKNHNIYSGVPLLDGEPDFRYVKYGSTYLTLVPSDNVPISFKVYKNGYIQYNVHDMSEYYMTVDPALVEYLFQ